MVMDFIQENFSPSYLTAHMNFRIPEKCEIEHRKITMNITVMFIHHLNTMGIHVNETVYHLIQKDILNGVDLFTSDEFISCQYCIHTCVLIYTSEFHSQVLIAFMVYT